MRDYLKTSEKERAILAEAARENGSWRPWRGSYAMARRLCKAGLLKASGYSVMPPHVLYVISAEGQEELDVAARLKGLGNVSRGTPA